MPLARRRRGAPSPPAARAHRGERFGPKRIRPARADGGRAEHDEPDDARAPSALPGPRDLDPARRRHGPVRRRLGPGGHGGPGGHVRFARGTRKSLELALREAIRLRSGRIGPEHLALGLLRADDDAVRLVFGSLAVDVAALRHDLESTAGRRTA
ncbi:MAG: Clp protease N-terminal domain-containing protein [Dermatophilaceae bacterium]